MKASTRYKEGRYNYVQQDWQSDGSVKITVQRRAKGLTPARAYIRCQLRPPLAGPNRDTEDTTKWIPVTGKPDEDDEN